jgi:hypothetical protein
VHEVRKKSGSAFLSAFNFFVFFDKKLIPMKTIVLFSLLFTFSTLHAQSNLSIFNNNGQSFYVVLNGIRQNSKPETNVQVGQIKNGSYAVKVIFADGKTPDIDKNFMIDAPYDITARIIFKKGKGKLQLMGQEPTHGVIQEAVVYRPNDAAVYSDATTTIQTMPSASSTTIQTLPSSSSLRLLLIATTVFSLNRFSETFSSVYSFSFGVLSNIFLRTIRYCFFSSDGNDKLDTISFFRTFLVGRFLNLLK